MGEGGLAISARAPCVAYPDVSILAVERFGTEERLGMTGHRLCAQRSLSFLAQLPLQLR